MTYVDILVSRIRQRLLEQNKNYLSIFLGETGAGKSYSALRLAELCDPNFSVERVVFTPEDFLKAVKEAKRGDFIIFDEAGVGIPSREWYRLQNKLLGYVVQVFRHKNLGVLFTTPNINFIDKMVRSLFHAIIHVSGVNRERNVTVCHYYHVKINPVLGSMKLELLTLYVNGSPVEVDPLYLSMPSKDLVKAYEGKKSEFVNQLYEDALNKAQQQQHGISHWDVKRYERLMEGVVKLCETEGVPTVARKMGIPERTLRRWYNDWRAETVSQLV